MRLLRLIPDGTTFGFMRFRRIAFPLSAFLSVLTIALFLGVGMNFGIDFNGGTLIEMQAKAGKADIAAVRSAAASLNLGDVEVQEFGTAGEVSMRFPLQPGGDAAQQTVVSKARTAFEANYEFRRTETVGPRISGELVQSGTLGIIISVLGVLVYLWFRFEWQLAVAAVVATLHDLVLTVGFFAITRTEFNMTSIAAVLTIVGYSLNDTVVVFDRIRELMRKYKKMPIEELLDLSINSTLARTIMVSLTTLLALIALAIFGGAPIEGFTHAMIFGVIVGTYSSIFIAAPVLIYLGLKTGGDTAHERAEAAAAEKVAGKAGKAAKAG
jgi:preprotein translocase subunit SecF